MSALMDGIFVESVDTCNLVLIMLSDWTRTYFVGECTEYVNASFENFSSINQQQQQPHVIACSTRLDSIFQSSLRLLFNVRTSVQFNRPISWKNPILYSGDIRGLTPSGAVSSIIVGSARPCSLCVYFH